MTIRELVRKLFELEFDKEVFIDTGDDIAHNRIGIDTVYEEGTVSGYVLVPDNPHQLRLKFDKENNDA